MACSCMPSFQRLITSYELKDVLSALLFLETLDVGDSISDASRLGTPKNHSLRSTKSDMSVILYVKYYIYVKRISTMKLSTTLRPHQNDFIRFCDGRKNVLCCDDMGLGKTLQSLALAVHDPPSTKFFTDGVLANRERGCTLVIMPKAVVTQWQAQFHQHVDDGKCLIYSRTCSLKEITQAHMVFCTYDALHHSPLLQSVQWWRLIVDEVHNIRNPESVKLQTILSLDRTRCLALTGTPINNTIEDLVPLAALLRCIGKDSMTYIRENKLHELKGILQPLTIRRVKSTTIGSALPSKFMIEHKVELADKHLDEYHHLETEAMADTRKSQAVRLFLALVPERLKSVAALVNEKVSGGDRVIVFSAWVQTLTALEEFLKVPFARSNGQMTTKARAQGIRSFQELPSALLMTISSGSAGLDLSFATHVVFHEPHWNPAMEHQAEDRVYRIGQTRDVYIHRFKAKFKDTKSTIEDTIGHIQNRKKRSASMVLNEFEGRRKQRFKQSRLPFARANDTPFRPIRLRLSQQNPQNAETKNT